MTDALERAFKEAQRLPEREQDELAALIEQRLSDVRWDELFARPESERLLQHMVNEACLEDDAGLARDSDKSW